jgi:RNA polymerase sigma-70 factor (ECF subfamily)
LELQPVPELQADTPKADQPAVTLTPDNKEVANHKGPETEDVIELDDPLVDAESPPVPVQQPVTDDDGPTDVQPLAFPPLRPRKDVTESSEGDRLPTDNDTNGQGSTALTSPVPLPPGRAGGKSSGQLEIREVPAPVSRSKTSGLHEPPLMAGAGAPIPPALLATLVIADAPRLRRFAAAMIGDEAMADDLVEATIEQALAAPGMVSAERDPGLSLLTILHRLRQQMLEEPTPARKASRGDSFAATLLQNLPGADQYELKAFAEAMSDLDEDDRAVLLLVALENLGYRDIAGMIKTPIGRVMSKVSRARENLRRALGENEQDETSLVIRSAEYQIAGIELHGYLDGELGDDRVLEIQAYLDQDDQASERLMHFGIQGDLIRRLYGPLINRAIPYQMAGRLVAMTRSKTLMNLIEPGRRSRLLIAATLLMAAGLGAFIWWYAGLSLGEVKSALAAQGWL